MNREGEWRKRECHKDIFCCQSQSWSVFWLGDDDQRETPAVFLCHLTLFLLPVHLSAFYIWFFFLPSLGYWLQLCISLILSGFILSFSVFTVYLFFPLFLLLLWWHPLVSGCVYLREAPWCMKKRLDVEIQRIDKGGCHVFAVKFIRYILMTTVLLRVMLHRQKASTEQWMNYFNSTINATPWAHSSLPFPLAGIWFTAEIYKPV